MLDSSVGVICASGKTSPNSNITWCEDLPPMDMSGFSDPFAMITCGLKIVKSKVLKSTLTPVWEQQFRFGDSQDSRRQRRRFSFRKGRQRPQLCLMLG